MRKLLSYLLVAGLILAFGMGADLVSAFAPNSIFLPALFSNGTPGTPPKVDPPANPPSVPVVDPDVTPPSVTIDQAPGQADPASIGPIHFTAIFSEPVSGFAAADIVIDGTAGAASVTIAGSDPGTIYDVEVNISSSGTVMVTIPPGAVADEGGNGNTASASNDNSVTSTEPVPPIEPVTGTGQITPLGVTCTQFADGDAADLDEATYTVQNGHIHTVTPAAFIYYSQVTAPAASFEIEVTQANPAGWSNLGNYFSFANPQINVYDETCKRINTTGTFMPTSITFNVTDAAAGEMYYVGIRYQADSVVGQKVTTPYPRVPYTFVTAVDNDTIDATSDSILISP